MIIHNCNTGERIWSNKIGRYNVADQHNSLRVAHHWGSVYVKAFGDVTFLVCNDENILNSFMIEQKENLDLFRCKAFGLRTTFKERAPVFFKQWHKVVNRAEGTEGDGLLKLIGIGVDSSLNPITVSA